MGTATHEFPVEIRNAVQYATHDGTALIGDLYQPAGAERRPVIVAVHGGGYQAGSRDFYQHWGPYLAARGYALFSIDYRLTRDEKNRYPAALHDVRAAVQWVHSHADDLKIDPERIALMGDSAVGHLGALVALAGDSALHAKAFPDDAYAHVSTTVKTVVSAHGIYDLIAQWEHDQVARPSDNITQNLMGAPPMHDRLAWYAASPIAHATFSNNGTSFLLVWGDLDDIVDPPSQSAAFLVALKQARCFVRTVVVPSAAHFGGLIRSRNRVASPGVSRRGCYNSWRSDCSYG